MNSILFEMHLLKHLAVHVQSICSTIKFFGPNFLIGSNGQRLFSLFPNIDQTLWHPKVIWISFFSPKFVFKICSQNYVWKPWNEWCCKGMVDVIKWRLISILVVTASCRTQYKLCVDMIGWKRSEVISTEFHITESIIFCFWAKNAFSHFFKNCCS